MKKLRLFLAVACATGFLPANIAEAFSIESVTLSPGNYVAPWFDVQMTVDITTPSQPAFLYAPTGVSSNSDGIHVDIYPSSGTVTALGSLRETVNLGSFPVGTYQYEVVIHPGYEVNWGTRTSRGSFTVVEDVPTVKLTANSWRTAEGCPSCPFAPVILTIERSGPTNAPTTVYLKVDGTATPGEDYDALPATIEIPAGEWTVQIPLQPIDDSLAEGPEVVRVRLNLSSNYRNLPEHSEVLIAIFDDEPDAPAARLDILTPTNGLHFGYRATVPLSALAIYTSNEVSGPVEFYAGDDLVARSPVYATGRPPIPGLPSIHTAYWTNPPAGQYILSARTTISYNQSITSPPVNITVEEPRLPIVSIGTSPPENAQVPELCPLNANCPAAGFVLRRIGPTNSDVRVFVSYSGTAIPDEDYHAFSNSIVIPAGQQSVFMPLLTINDSLVEGPETVVADLPLVPSPLYGVDTSHATASITIIDDDHSESNQPPVVTITYPTNHTEFPPNVSIDITAEARAPDSYIRTVEFFADDQKIGERTVEFTHPPDSGLTQSFAFTWREPTPGQHLLTARAIDNLNADASSDPVEITVTLDSLPIVGVAATDCFSVEPASNNVNTATFRIYRFGPTNVNLTIAYSLHGTAENGVDYETLSGTAIIPEGSSSVAVTVLPLADDLKEGTETVILQIEGQPEYQLGFRSQAVALISDTQLNLLPPNTTRWTLLPDNCLDVCFTASTGESFRVEASTDLRNWETVAVTTAADNTAHFVEDAMSNFAHRFYRLILNSVPPAK